MVRHTLKILQHLLQDFYSLSDHFTTLRSKGLILNFVKEDLPILDRSNKCALLQKSVFIVLSIIYNQKNRKKNIFFPIFETIINKTSIWNPVRFHGAFFEFEILEVFTTAFLWKIIWFQLSVLSLKMQKNIHRTKGDKPPTKKWKCLT